MSSYKAAVSYVPIRSSLVNIPNSVSSVLFNSNIPAQNVVLELIYSKRTISKSIETRAFVGWTGMTSASSSGGDPSSSVLEVDPTFAQTLGLSPRQQVTIKIHVNPCQAHTIHLEPLTTGDWEIVETHAQFLESWMINQVRAVSLQHGITVYPSATAIATLKVTKIEPEPTGEFAMISPDSEIIVAPKVKRQAKQQQEGSNGGTARSTTSHRRKQDRGSGSCVLLRGISLPQESYENLFTAQSLAIEVYGSREAVMYQLRGSDYINVSIVQPSSIGGKGQSGIAANNSQQQQQNHDEAPSGPVNSIIARFVQDLTIPEGHVVLSYGLTAALNIVESLGHVVRIEPALKPLSKQPNSLVLHPYIISTQHNSLKLGGSSEHKQEEERKLEEIKEILLERDFLQGPIVSGVQIPPLGEVLPFGGIIKLEKSEGWIKSGSAMVITQGGEILRAESTIPVSVEALSQIDPHKRNVVGIDKQFKAFKTAIRSGCIGTLLYGGRGSGKTVILHEIEKDLKKNLIHTTFLSCGLLGEKKISTLRDTIKKLFLEAAWFAPSIVILDDIDKLIPAELEHVDSSNTIQLAEIFKQIAFSVVSQRPVSILATAQSKESMHSSLITSHLFEEIFHLRSPDKDVREAILKEAVASYNSDKGAQSLSLIDLVDVAGTTEGYNPGDLWTLTERANHQSILKSLAKVEDSDTDNNNNNNTISIAQEDFDKAMEDFTPASLRGVKLQQSSVSWKDIGGLGEAKKIILETLEWPTKYAPIFANCPLRLRSGLLLYGYPGCGKTLLASAVAAQCGLNFISVKGPEILNKYIGASEQSVRDLFERAQAAKPCILFFDEFDSIAPKRGHDSTGVTDRVVNQMLTQMDGAEGLDGVYVLAATSRPDLIDSALLRPGRLDKSIICDMPNFEDRLSILQAVQGTMKLRKDVSLRDVAAATSGYSGADLQALLYNAYLDAIHEVVDNELDGDVNSAELVKNHEFFQLQALVGELKSVSLDDLPVGDRTGIIKKLDGVLANNNNNSSRKDDEKPSDKEGMVDATTSVIITPEHIERSLQESKPSISVKERTKLEHIYNQFVSGRSGEMPSGTASMDIGGRATLM